MIESGVEVVSMCGESLLETTKSMSNVWMFFSFQAQDGIRDLVRSRGLGDVDKGQAQVNGSHLDWFERVRPLPPGHYGPLSLTQAWSGRCLLYYTDAAEQPTP